MLQLPRRSVNIFPKSHRLWDVIYTFVFADTHHPTSPLQRTHIAFQFHSRHVTVVLEYFASVRRKKKKKSNRNFIMVSPLSGPADPHFRGGFHPTSHSGGAIFFDHISFIAPLTAASVCSLLLLQISPGLLVFILDLDRA